jgi:phosphate transport system protein
MSHTAAEVSMVEHTIRVYDDDLKALRDRVSEMGESSEQMLASAMNALKRQDIQLSQEVILSDTRLDHLQREIEERTITNIARRHPVAIDLREMIAAMRIAALAR